MPWPKLPLLPPLLSGLRAEADRIETLSNSLPEFVAKVYQYAITLRGEEEAKQLFLNTIIKKRGDHGKHKRYIDVNRDAFLLREYNQSRKGMTPEQAKRLPRILGNLVDRAAPGRYGNSADTITRHIRRLRDQQEKRRGRPAGFFPSGTVLSERGK